MLNNIRFKNKYEKKAYIEHAGKVVQQDKQFEHMMAITLDPRNDYRTGVIRCIKSRDGDVGTYGFIDRSVLHKISGDSLESFHIGERIILHHEKEITKQLSKGELDFLGVEDPDIWIDDQTGLLHLYFTLPFRDKTKDEIFIHLGHAVGKDLDSLTMTSPVLMPDDEGNGAKEVSIAPLNKQKFRYNLVESGIREEDFYYSTVRVAIVKNMGRDWKYGEIAFHPAKHNIPWIAGHASPGPLFPKKFCDVGEGKQLGVMNGREANIRIGETIKFGTFSVGLFIYDYEHGKIEWVSEEPFIQDSQAQTITFASQFVETTTGEGILYAHVDDSFVRAYSLNAEAIKSLLP